ncbi:hypothetical protein PHLGIDRAFT_124740 [Phlebiopsis gigantea 11061_1 CR5-6]|uniref:Alpha-ketoglutarate-dependent dioxygenase AlkB-like domain-containing protein n=1 Tax=Phlebiopsis gigantea (strain 11061_1 CR5-6) TaxID=745531 RepID=A0A0C3PUZ0_PHLG1|nr:hypothetical protein PHLGIDRAFT_124740 [Phlebiopsis gigantea 11061_1 CR5-6]
MVLRIPKHVLDRDLLEDEPFHSTFAAQRLKGNPIPETRRSSTRPELYSDIENAMRAEPHGLDAARAWLRTVFHSVFVEEADIESQDLDVFVTFYWLVSTDGPRHAADHLLEQSKKRGMNGTWSNAASIMTEPPPPRAVPVTVKRPSPTTYKKAQPKRGSGAIRERKKLKAEPEVVSKSIRTKQSSLTAPIPHLRHHASASSISVPPTASRNARAAGTECVPAPQPGFQRSPPARPTKKRGRKRRAEKTPSLSGSSSADESPSTAIDPIPSECPSSPLTSICYDSETELPTLTETRTLPPTLPTLSLEGVLPGTPAQSSNIAHLSLGAREQPPRRAANRDGLQQLVADKNAYEKGLRRGKAPHSPRTIKASPSSTSPQVRPPREESEAASRKPRTKPWIAKAPPTSDSRPEKKRRGNTSNPIVPAEATEAGSTVTGLQTAKTRKPESFFDSPCRLDFHGAAPNAESTGSRLGSSPPISPTPFVVPTLVDLSIDKGRKRLRDAQPAAYTEDEPGKAPEDKPRLIIRIPRPRDKASLVSVAPYPPRPNGVEYADCVIRDAAENGLIELRNEEEQASEWEQDPDDPQPGDSSDEEYEPPTPKPKGKKARRAKHRTEPHEGSINYVENQDMEIIAPKSSVFKQDDPRLTPCPLFDDPPPAQDGKAVLPSLPPIWAQSRQEVCESFDWFRSYQGGVYFVKDIVKGYLLSAFASSRDLFHHGGKLIISHGGGKAAQSLAKAPGTVNASDQQEDDKSVRALLHNYRTRRPLVLIIDDKYALFPFDLASQQCTYAILGWYQIAYAWAEFQGDPTSPSGRVVRYKFAFQWCEAQGEPWWPMSAETQLEPSICLGAMSDGEADEKLGQVCTHCSQPSPEVYEEGWMCLRPRCTAFWCLLDASEVPTSLNYAASFLRPLKLETAQTLEDLRPPLPVSVTSNKKEQVITTSRHFCKGWHCSKCGRLSSRYKWEHWECRNCGATYSILGRQRTANEFFRPPKSTFDTHKINAQSGIITPKSGMFESTKGFGARLTFILPYNRGKIHALLSRPTMNAQANEVLRQYQEQASEGTLKFRRWPLRSHKCRGTLLTNYFSQNTGEPYQYVGGTANTVPFDEAPTAVTGALDLIKTRISEAHLGFDPNFNEVLTAAYMEEQKMAFHSDAERGLGPNVASLSLGAGAHMHFRIHAQYAAQDGLTGSREVLTLFLRHGDVVVMEGAGIQEYYEHTVVPLNFRIAATARFIGNEHLGS